MKLKIFKYILAISILSISTGLIAATITVDNKVNSAAQYTDLQDALDAANSGDTVLVAGSPTTYGSILIEKELILIGNGYRIDSEFDYATTVSTVTFNDDVDPDDPTDSYMAGFVTGSVYFYYGLNLLMERCKTGAVWFDNNNVSATLRNVIIDSYIYMYPDVHQSVVVQNSILRNGIYNTNPTSILEIDHCMFLDNSMQYSDIQYTLIRNSIVYGVSAAGGENMTFASNMCYIEGSTTTFEIGGTNTGDSDENVDPMFTDIQNVSFSYSNDYTIQAGSPALTSADDGGEIGIFGGAYPFPSGGTGTYALSPQAAIPVITGLNIENPSVPENGTLNVNIQATKKD